MKLIRSNPALNLGRSVSDFGPWLRHPFAGFPAMAQLLEDFFPSSASPSNARLATDLHEDANHFYARFELPGVKKDAVKVELREGVLTVTAERRERAGENTSSVTLSRSITLPDAVQEEAISARLEDGILTVSLPKQEHRKPRLITVN